ncbi:MAG: RloB domain-containing protein [Legionellales bacterium]|nr:RloB domain-containing protein [Legionellales bacterium]
MGTDNLHFKRKQQSIKTLARKKGQRKPYDVVLIVCEGSKTEPNYLKGLCEYLQLNPANIVIKSCSLGNDPMSIVNFALKEHKRDDYDRIYCVFDKEHTNYQQALDKISSQNKISIYAITSSPCFEYWLLLHYEDTSKPFHEKSNKSVGDQLKSLLKKYIKNYHEANKDIFVITQKHLKQAIIRAKRIDKMQEKNGTDNPSTKVYQLVEYLISIKK